VLPDRDTEELQIGIGHGHESQIKIKEHTDDTDGGSYVMARSTRKEGSDPASDRPAETMATAPAGAPGKPETFRDHLPAILGAAGGTLIVTVLASWLGNAGTLIGVALGSLGSGTLSWWAERGIRRARAATAAAAQKVEAVRVKDHQPHPAGDAAITRPAHHRTRRNRRWATPVGIVLAAFLGCAIPLTIFEHAAGKPISAVTRHQPGHGTTLFGGGTGTPSPSPPARTPAPTAPATSSAATPAAPASPSATSRAATPAPTPTVTGAGTGPAPGGGPAGGAPQTGGR